jgi:drug/metabolite transporter (DMT)-like permease
LKPGRRLAGESRSASDPDQPASRETVHAPAMGSGRNRPLEGALWMLGATTCFAIMAVAIRYLKGQQNAFDITFWRSCFGTLVMLPFMLRGMSASMFRTARWKLFGFRALCTYLAMASYFFALANMDNIVDAVALNATIPLFTVLLAAMFLPESVGWRRWAATAVGFAGVMVVLRPGFQEIGAAAILATASGFFYAAAGVLVKVLSRTEPTARIVFYMNFFLVLIAAGPFFYQFNLPPVATLPWLVVIGITGTLAHVCITRAYSAADASFCAPFDFWRLLLVVFAGWIFFGDAGSHWTWVGGLIVFGSAIYITRREAQRARAARTAATAEL